MEQIELKKINLPDQPGVYRFIDERGHILYIGKATSLKNRVRSYFANDLLHTRGKHIVDMVTLAKTVTHETTDTVLEAVILEAALIKKHQPLYNTKEKDNKSFNYVVATNEPFPKVLVLRERNMLSGDKEMRKRFKFVFGPFPHGTDLAEAMKIIRRIFPYRDTCTPQSGKPCFNRQLGLCPGVCSGEMSAREYDSQITNIKLFFQGKKSAVLSNLKKSMYAHADKQEFEIANEYKKHIFGLMHINDASLIKREIRAVSQHSARTRGRAYRIEAYDVAHISGKYTVGVMVVVEDGRPKKSDYRKFKIRIDKDLANDTLHLEEVLNRRFGHHEWPKPDLLVVDGGVAQRRTALRVLKKFKLDIAVVGVVKDERHKPKMLIGNKELTESYKYAILIANGESHRFAVAYHRQLRDKILHR